MTAENRRLGLTRAELAAASMRPRPMTAENVSLDVDRRSLRGRFNEAAADDRGKPTRGLRMEPARIALQ